MKTVVSAARELLAGACAAAVRLEDRDDVSALHDFRVGLRRLNVHLRAYRRDLKGTVAFKTRKHLRRVLASTGRARDVQVELSWLRGPGRRIPGARELIVSLSGLVLVHDRTLKRFRREAGRLSRALAAARPGKSLEASAARALEHWCGKLDARRPSLEDLLEPEKTHALRIAVRRLRYVLEPFAGRLECGRAVKCLTGVQDALGDIHERDVLAEEFARHPRGRRLLAKVRLEREALRRGFRRESFLRLNREVKAAVRALGGDEGVCGRQIKAAAASQKAREGASALRPQTGVPWKPVESM